MDSLYNALPLREAAPDPGPASVRFAMIRDRERIPCRLCRCEYKRITPSHLRYRHGIGLDAYRDQFPVAPLTSAEMRDEMSRYISMSWEARSRHWTGEQVLADLIRAAGRGIPLSAKAVVIRDRKLFSAARRIFGTWDEALSLAGLDPLVIRRRRRWTAAEILQEIRKERISGGLRRRKDLMQAARSVFGSWRKALGLAGVKARRAPGCDWTPELVISTLRRRVHDGLSLAASDVHDQAPALWRAARRFFPAPWPALLRSLGLPYSGRERWSRDSVIQTLRRLAGEVPTLQRREVRKACPAVVSAGTRIFGSWSRAVAAAKEIS